MDLEEGVEIEEGLEEVVVGTEDVSWKSPRFRNEMKEQLQQALEENLRRMGEMNGVKLTRWGIGYSRSVLPSKQTMATVRMNAKIMEEEVFKASNNSKDKYIGRMMTAIIHGNVFGPAEKLEEGLKRWCWEEGREVCKELIKVDKKLVWAECMEYEELVRETVDINVITIPVDEKGLVKEWQHGS